MLALPLSVVLLAVLLLLLARVAPWLLEWLHVCRMMAQLPGPPALPLLGNLLDFEDDADKFHRKLMGIFVGYTTIIRFWLGTIPLVVLKSPDDIQQIFGNMKFIEKPKLIYKSVEPLFAGGLPLLDPKTWRAHRKAITHTFHQDILKGFVHAFYENALWITAELEKKADEGSVFNVTPLCGLVAGRAVVETVLASSNEGLSEDERDALVASIERACELTGRRWLHPWLLSDWVYSFTGDCVDFKTASSLITNLCRRLIHEKRRALDNAGGVQKAKRLTFLDRMMASTEDSVLNDKELLEETKTLIVTATGTSMDVLSFMFHVLAVRPGQQDMIVQELKDVFGEEPRRPVTDSDLPHLQHTERFVKETLRFFPPVPFFGRSVTEDIVLPSGHTLPRGCTVGVFVSSLHHQPEVFPDPDRFDPDRFLPENSQDRHPFAFIPFSAGPRNCIAHRYAMMFLVTQLATVLRHVRVLPAPGADPDLRTVPITTSLTTSITGGAHIRTSRRQLQP